MKERKKPGLKKVRKASQFPKRLNQFHNLNALRHNDFYNIGNGYSPCDLDKYRKITNIEFSNLFADVGKPCQRPLNENSNGILRRNGLPKQMDFNTISQQEVNEITAARNNLPRKSLHYLTPIECFLQHADVSRLI
ncbi:hypothetical protein HPK16_04860 [Listeria sp. W9-0585]|uniref:Integrase catalytic domain-containing protein n=1 Tax=Listeria rustica TaxID=2713503 RepID=A0A7W1YFK7_9LIST|nr:hypothetical protein [Listeria rustica]